MQIWIQQFLELLALPQYALSTVFVVSFVSATLLPLGSEPVVFGLIKLNPELFWPTIFAATAGNTLGGALDWALGNGARRVADRVSDRLQNKSMAQSTDGLTDKPENSYPSGPQHSRALRWLEKLGPKACLLAWLPLVGDPLCAVAGWLAMPFWRCFFYMAVGKFLRYVSLTSGLVWAFPSGWSF